MNETRSKVSRKNKNKNQVKQGWRKVHNLRKNGLAKIEITDLLDTNEGNNYVRAFSQN